MLSESFDANEVLEAATQTNISDIWTQHPDLFMRELKVQFSFHALHMDVALLVTGVTYVEMGLGVNKQLNGLGPLTLTDIEFDKLQLDPDGLASKEIGIQIVDKQTESSDYVKKEPIWNHHASMNVHFQREGG
ncbi:MAG: hypothetical protein EZS28_010374 [Streblomastix strix]|uniref:Uncharacterized protein n=1 Tax=Streblomastix strix TaxID=222440 RepID=A0A5J4WID6_9EUKA|nr:MAG: hypothetical protein EZS28_010374 [Streblomastix strix]